jgi:CO/xanthine dehydrogenase Mo-binding subunit
MAQIAAETLGLEAEAVRVVAPDTDVTPYDMGTLGSRSTFHMGHAVRLAAAEAKTKLAALAAETGVPPDNTTLAVARILGDGMRQRKAMTGAPAATPVT